MAEKLSWGRLMRRAKSRSSVKACNYPAPV